MIGVNKIGSIFSSDLRDIPKAIFDKLIEKTFGFDITKFINEAAKIKDYNTYLEIGVQNGVTFRSIKGIKNKIAVDVKRLEEFNILKDDESFYEMNSDEFFSNVAPSLFQNKKIDIAFIDGHHEFYQVMRDFVNVEKYIAKNGIIFLHDCNPISEKHAGDDYGGGWNGDVWKFAYLLFTNRKDLKYCTLNCDEGVGVVFGFDNKNQGLSSLSQEHIQKIKNMNYDSFKNNRKDYINLKSPFYWKEIIKIF